MEWMFLMAGLVAGFVLGWLLKRTPRADIQELETLRRQHIEASAESNTRKGANELLEKERQNLQQQLARQQSELLGLTNELGAARSNAHHLETKLANQQQELETLQQRFTKEFELVANRLFDEKTQKFTEQNRSSLDQVLGPLKERIRDFEEKVQKHYEEETREKASLKQQILMLHDLNQQMSRETLNLTKALKGESKTQGSWGEYILEGVLERSGLMKGREYELQMSLVTPEGKRMQPDAIVHLPEGRHLVIDSKVSLLAYDRWVSAEDEAMRDQAIREHTLSVKRHIKELGDKNYHALYGLKTLDFVIMFVPVEPAFAAAVQFEGGLFQEAFEKNIMIVSPSTLLAALRTIASIWRQEKQNRNAFEIAAKAGDLYDKFRGFIDDMNEVSKRMEGARAYHEEAMKKLSTGRGNIISTLEKVKQLGAKANKTLPSEVIANAQESDTGEPA